MTQPQSMYHSPQRTVVVGFWYNILGSRVGNFTRKYSFRSSRDLTRSHRAQALTLKTPSRLRLTFSQSEVIDAVVRSMRSTVLYLVWIPRALYGHVVNVLPGPARPGQDDGFSQPWVQQSQSRAVQPTLGHQDFHT
jgi:hypothetical protein